MSNVRAEDRKRVEEMLIGPLQRAGLQRKRGQTLEAHAAVLGRIANRLAYMSDDSLRGMEELVLRQAQRGVWPDEALLINWAYTLQCPPPRDSSYARSLVRSALGRRARDEGWAVELLRVARRLGPPPQRYVESKLREAAADATRRRERIRERIEAGWADKEDRDWLAAWHADAAEVEAIQSAVDETDGDSAGGVAA